MARRSSLKLDLVDTYQIITSDGEKNFNIKVEMWYLGHSQIMSAKIIYLVKIWHCECLYDLT